MRGRIIAALVTVPFAAAAEKAEKWTYAATDNFELYTTASPKRAREGIRFFEQARSFFLEVLKIDPKLPSRVRLIAFNTEKEWLPYRPNETADAYYQPGLDRDFIVMRNLDGEGYPVVVHEYVHLLMKHLGFSDMPLWLNEGLAELYSNMKPVGGKMQVGTIHVGRYQLLRQEKWLPLSRLLEVKHDSPEYNTKGHAGVFYSQAWALTHMLQLSEAYRPKSAEFLAKVMSGAKGADAFRAAYGKYLSDVELDLKEYMSGDRFRVALFNYKPVKSEAEIDVRAATTFEAELTLASLLSHSPDQEQARVLLDRLKSEQPDNLELLEMLGLFHHHLREEKAAIEHYGKAIEKGSKNHSVYFRYSHAVRAQSPEKAMDAMRKAVELNPNDTDYVFWFGQILLDNKRDGEALSALTSLKRVKPERAFYLFSALSHCYLNLKNPEQARISAMKAKEYARDDSQRTQAERQISYLDQRQDYEAKKKAYEAAMAARRTKAAATGTEAAQANGSPEAPPALERRAPPAPGSAEELAQSDDEEFRKRLIERNKNKVTGKLTMIDCLGQQARVHLDAGTKKLRFWIQNPSSIAISGAPGAVVEFSCGPQKGTTVTIGFNPKADAKRAVDGELTSMEFH